MTQRLFRFFFSKCVQSTVCLNAKNNPPFSGEMSDFLSNDLVGSTRQLDSREPGIVSFGSRLTTGNEI